MTEVIKLNAMNLDEARKRALKVLEINSNQILKITEETKGSSFFGFFAKEGSYTIEYTLEEIKEEIKEEVKKEIVKPEPIKVVKKVIEPEKLKPMTREEIAKDIETKKVKTEPETNFDSRHTARDMRKEKEDKRVKTESRPKPPVKKEKPEFKKQDSKKYESAQVKQEPKIEVNEAKLEEILTQAKKLIKFMELNLEVNFEGISGRNYVINLSGEDKGIIIGKKGKTLNSYEYLLNSLVKDARIDVDVEEFKSKRNETLVELANKIAKKAITTRKVVRLNPMPPRERKIIHEIINQYPELDTYSEGREPKRYIIVKVKR